MKKILEVLQYGETDIRFNTDVDPAKDPEVVTEVIAKAAMAMTTKLWGGNEQAVIAMIRALSIADLAVCAHRKEMIRSLDNASMLMAKSMRKAREEFEKKGGKIIVFGPGAKPGAPKN